MKREDFKKEIFRILDGVMEGKGIMLDDINTLNFGVTLGWEFINTFGSKKLATQADETHIAWFEVFSLESIVIDEELVIKLKQLTSSAYKLILEMHPSCYSKLHWNLTQAVGKYIKEEQDAN